MTTKGKKILTESEKCELLAKSIIILKCGDKAIVDAFTAKVNAIAETLKSEKKKKAVKK